MARIRLRESETRARRLPDVCMACGDAADTHVTKTFSWYPSWANLLILCNLIVYIVVIAVISKRMTVQVPFCDRHRNYFGKRLLWTILALVGFFTLWLVPTIAIASFADSRNEGPLVNLFCFGFVLATIGAVVTIAVIQSKTIRPVEITDRDITLIRVNDAFVDALHDLRDERRGRSRDDDDEFDPPRRDDDDRDRDRPRRPSSGYRSEPPDQSPPRRRRNDDED